MTHYLSALAARSAACAAAADLAAAVGAGRAGEMDSERTERGVVMGVVCRLECGVVTALLLPPVDIARPQGHMLQSSQLRVRC